MQTTTTLLVLVVACGTSPSFTGSTDAARHAGQAAGAQPWKVPACDDAPPITAPETAYRDAPIYVANEMPDEEVRSWARQQTGFQGIWVDRDHNGWITVAFTHDAEQRQVELERLFPDVGIVAVEMENSFAELEALRKRVHDELGPELGSLASSIYEDKGVVGLTVGVLSDEARTEIQARFPGAPLCVDGGDPALVPAPGPQPRSGDGWLLLADESGFGEPYRTGIAFDDVSLRNLWQEVGLHTPVPRVDFQTHVVIWFGAVFGSSCPNLRLDDVIVRGSIVHALIVLPDVPVVCTGDANPHAFVVAVEREDLPKGSFSIQLDEDGPPPGAPEERTVVDADLSPPGATASPDQIGADPNLPESQLIESGDVIEPGLPLTYRLYVHCGIEWLGEVNMVTWRTNQPVPPEWEPMITQAKTIDVTVTLRVEPEARITAEANGVAVSYEPTTKSMPGCD